MTARSWQITSFVLGTDRVGREVGGRRRSEMGEDACRTFQGSKSVIWYLLRCLKLKWTTRDLAGTF